MKSKDVIKKIEAAGWAEVRVKGSHHHFKHPTLPGLVTVPHPEKDLPIGTLKSIEKQSGVQLISSSWPNTARIYPIPPTALLGMKRSTLRLSSSLTSRRQVRRSGSTLLWMKA
jgi:predicted RNA binding protein YcfA (HicA-like mRNA interferase family)